ncbi:MAG TPA: hypothetical protein VNG90_02030 [Candidatus Acidoferrum sp.]|nr:hypothetical protein [Candidatus Acidoferrum sp.]
MNIIPPHHPAATSDDEEDLKKILTGASTNPNEPAQPTGGIDGLQFEDPAPVIPTAATKRPAEPEVPKAPEPQPAPAPTPVVPAAPPTPPPVSGDLEAIKKSALEELRPLVDKLNLEPEEKFDTLLLIIRSTDDQSLLAEAHQTAQSITDEAKRAEALLDIIKEIDYFSTQTPAASA